MINVALIGVSGFGSVHYKDLMRYHQDGKVKFIGATIINQDEESEKCSELREIGCRIFADYKLMLQELKGQLDLCFIPTGIGLHREMAIAAMEHGASAMIEKPAAPTIQDIKAMRETERKTGKFVAVGFQSIYQPEIQRIKREIVEGRFGKIKCIRGLGLWPRDNVYYSRNNWAGKLKVNDGWILDSPFNNALGHYLNLLGFFGGSVFEKSADLSYVDAQLYRCNPEIETTDCASIKLHSREGVDILFHTCHCSEATFGPEITVDGDKGRVIWGSERAILEYEDHAEMVDCSNHKELRDNLMESVIRRVNDPSAFICGLDIAGAHVLAVNGAHESSAVNPVPCKKTLMADGLYRFIYPEINDFFHRLYAEARMPRAEDYTWIIPGEKFDLQDYQEFNGGKTGL